MLLCWILLHNSEHDGYIDGHAAIINHATALLTPCSWAAKIKIGLWQKHKVQKSWTENVKQDAGIKMRIFQ